MIADRFSSPVPHGTERRVARRVGPALRWFIFLGVGAVAPALAWGEDASEPLRVASVTRGVVASAEGSPTVPAWAADAVFYQLFPERFANGDHSNDPTRESLEFQENVPESWAITPWGSDWYARAEWEKERGGDFYEDGVFDRRYGGDLQGVLDRLDYIEDLGVNVVYFNPIFYARSLHKYDGNTFHHVDPHFGPDPQGDFALMATETSDPSTWKQTAADKLFVELVRQLHKRDIRVVLDGVFNHTGIGFFAFENLREKQQASPYRDWYVVQSFDNPATPANEFNYKAWWGVMTLPEFANNEADDDLHPGPKEYIFNATGRWMDPNGDGDPSDGIDGWRLDVAVEVPVGFWQDWNAHVRRINPEAYTVAEHWEDAARFLEEGGFSATMNYHGFAWPVKGYLIDGAFTPTDAAKMLVERMEEYPADRRYALQNLIDSHDTDRVASMTVNASATRPYLQPERFDYDVGERVSPRNGDKYKVRKPNAEERRIQRMVGVMQATFVGAPMIYYGTEAGMWGADDPCDRKPMVWRDLRYEDEASDPLDRERPADKVTFDHELYAFYRAANRLRHDHSALRRGDFEVVLTDDKARGLVYRRSDANEELLVVFNRGDNAWTVELPSPGGAASSWSEVFTATGETHRIKLDKGAEKVRVTLPGREVVVLHRFKEAE